MACIGAASMDSDPGLRLSCPLTDKTGADMASTIPYHIPGEG